MTILRIAIGIGLLLYVLSVTDGWQVIRKLGSSPWIILALPMVAILGAGVEAIRLQLLCRAQRIQISLARGYQLSALGSLYNFVIPGGTGGDVMKLYYMARDNRGRMVETGLVLLVDRAVSLFGLLLLVLALSLINWDLVIENSIILWFVIAAAAVAAAELCVMQLSLSPRLRRSHFYGFVTRTLSFGNVLRRVLDALYAFREHKRQMLMGLGWTFCGHALLAGMMLATGIVLIPEAPVQIIPFLSLLGSLANAIPITPGGMGVGEAATEKLYGLAGFSGGAALILTWRLSTLPLCVIGAIVSMVGLKRRSLAMQAHKEEAVSTHTVPTE